jgi:hypothetical protein
VAGFPTGFRRYEQGGRIGALATLATGGSGILVDGADNMIKGNLLQPDPRALRLSS